MSNTARTPRVHGAPVHGWSWRRIASLVLFGGIGYLASLIGKGSKPATGAK